MKNESEIIESKDREILCLRRIINQYEESERVWMVLTSVLFASIIFLSITLYIKS